MYYDYSNRNHLTALRQRLTDITHEQKVKIVSFCWANRLMLSRGYVAWWAFHVGKLLDRKNGGYNFYLLYFSRDDMRLEVNRTFNKILHHMVNGTDLSDLDSAGGWNEQEFAAFIACVCDVGCVI